MATVTYNPAANPIVLDLASQRLSAEFGCSAERALDLIYGAAAAHGLGLYECAHLILTAHDLNAWIALATPAQHAPV